jgi:hypothetical protein
MSEYEAALPFEPPRVVRLARRACALAALPALIYIGPGLIQLDHLAAGQAFVGEQIGPMAILGLANALRDFTVLAIVLCAFAVLTLGSFTVVFTRVGDRARIAAIASGVLVFVFALLTTAADGSTLLMGDVVLPEGQITEEASRRYSAAMVMPWFPVLHYVTVAALLVGGAAAVITLAHSDAREYFRRHRQLTADPRVWSISRLRRERTERHRGPDQPSRWK